MSEQIVHYNETRYNNIDEATIAASTITANYQSVLNLGTGETRNGLGTKNTLSLENTLNQTVTLAFVGIASTTTKTVSAQTQYTFDRYPHWGNLFIKAQSTLPTSGQLIISSW